MGHIYRAVNLAQELLDHEVMFSDDCISEYAIGLSKQMLSREVHLLENLRFHPGEKQNDEKLSSHYLIKSKWLEKFGQHFEQRVGLVYFSIIGRNCTQKKREEYYIWDTKLINNTLKEFSI